MNYQNGQTTGSKWFFFLVMVILFGAIALGFNLKDAKWLNREIASATARQMNVATNIDQQKAELDLQVLQAQTEMQVTMIKQQAEYEAAKQQQELDAAANAAIQRSNFQAGLYNTFNFGLMVMVIAFSTALIVAGISAAAGLHKIMNAKAQAIQPSQNTGGVVSKHQPSVAVQKARQQEREEREKQLMDNRMNQIISGSKVVWPAQNHEAGTLQPENYPWAG